MRIIPIIAILFFSCSYNYRVIKSKEYKAALGELTFHIDKKYIIGISKEELNRHRVYIYNGDTINIEANKRVFGMKNISNGKIFIYLFNNSGLHRRIECDSNWKVLFINIIEDAYTSNVSD